MVTDFFSPSHYTFSVHALPTFFTAASTILLAVFTLFREHHSIDITERKKSQEALIKKSAELARANAEREQLELFTYVASHDLSAPLQKIVGFGDLLKAVSAGSLSAKAGDYLERMQAAARRMARLIDDLMKFSRLTMAKAALEPEIVEHHGGMITAKSAPNQGAAFSVTLPGRIREVFAVNESMEARCL